MTFLLSGMKENRTPASGAAPVGKVVRRADHTALVDARRLIEQARVDAAAIVEQARAACQAERERGYADGMAAAKQEQVDAMMRISQQTSVYLKQVERELVDVVVASLRKIVADFDATDRVMAVVRGALALVRLQKHVLLRVHPDDAVLVRQHMQALLAQFPSVDYVDVVADDRFASGSCRIETVIGTVETSLEHQLGALRQALEKVDSHAPGPGGGHV
jgi:type III secretion protein L